MHEKTRMRLRRSSYNKKISELSERRSVNFVNLVNDDSVVSDVTQHEVTILQVVDGF